MATAAGGRLPARLCVTSASWSASTRLLTHRACRGVAVEAAVRLAAMVERNDVRGSRSAWRSGPRALVGRDVLQPSEGHSFALGLRRTGVQMQERSQVLAPTRRVSDTQQLVVAEQAPHRDAMACEEGQDTRREGAIRGATRIWAPCRPDVLGRRPRGRGARQCRGSFHLSTEVGNGKAGARALRSASAPAAYPTGLDKRRNTRCRRSPVNVCMPLCLVHDSQARMNGPVRAADYALDA